jgi:hypothetical protein
MGNYPGINLVATVYGDDLADKSYREAQGLMQSYPDLKAIIAPTTVGIVAAVAGRDDAGKIGRSTSPALACRPKWPVPSSRARRSPSRSGTRSTLATPPR